MLCAWLHRRSAWLFHAAAALGFGGRRALGAWILYSFRFPIAWLPSFAGFGPFTRRGEIENILDNFLDGTLRFASIEDHLRRADRALVIDVGVNLGITLRWWMHLNPRTQIIAIDMMREAHEFATRALARAEPRYPAQLRSVEAVVSDAEGSTTITFDDPLDGMNASDARGGATSRELPVRTLDAIWAEAGGRDVFLLKIDIEGAGSRAMAGAGRLLRRTRFVVAEWHCPAELTGMTSACLDAGLSLVCTNKKMLFFERTAAAA